MAVRDRVLRTSYGYDLFRRLVGADRAMERIVREHLRPFEGARILDIGCGNGDLARFLPRVDYVGVDHNPAYVERAGSDFGRANVSFIDGDLEDLPDMDIGDVDLAIAVGVVHHLGDDLAKQVINTTRGLLKPAGRFITIDPVFEPDQRSVTRVMLALDRGRFVRHPAHYQALMDTSFDDVELSIHRDLLPIPYTHCIMSAQKPRG